MTAQERMKVSDARMRKLQKATDMDVVVKCRCCECEVRIDDVELMTYEGGGCYICDECIAQSQAEYEATY